MVAPHFYFAFHRSTPNPSIKRDGFAAPYFCVRYLHIMHKFLFALSVLLISSVANAREYGNYDPKRLLTVSETPSGKKHGFDGAYLDQMLNDLSSHAKNYPPQFDSPDRRRARGE
jgi:hypothetical protein